MWYFQAQLAGPRTGIQKFSQYYPSSMLPPPPPAPMARPVAIIRSTGELTATNSNSPPTSSTSPTDPGELASNQEQMAAAAAVGLVSSGCQSSVDPAGRKSPARILVTAPHTSREYTFAHFHSQPGQVSLFSPRNNNVTLTCSFFLSTANIHVSYHQFDVRGYLPDEPLLIFVASFGDKAGGHPEIGL